jgi:cytochrome b561
MNQVRYSLTARILHWLVGVLVLGQIGLGFIADAASRDRAEALGKTHAELGLLLLVLMILRLTWRIAVPPPPLLLTVTSWSRSLATIVHRLLYLLVFTMLASGLAVWMWIGGPLDLFGLIPFSLPDLSARDEFWLSVAGYAHEYGAWAISALIALHIAGAIFHEIVLRDRLIRDRML